MRASLRFTSASITYLYVPVAGRARISPFYVGTVHQSEICVVSETDLDLASQVADR